MHHGFTFACVFSLSLVSFFWPEKVLADLLPPVKPFNGKCYCQYSEPIDESGGSFRLGSYRSYRMEFQTAPIELSRDNEAAAAKKDCERSAKETNGEVTLLQRFAEYCQKGGRKAPAPTKPCSAEDIQCGARQYER